MPSDEYRFVVDLRLAEAFGTSVEARLADRAVRAAQCAGYTPIECVEWLAWLDGL